MTFIQTWYRVKRSARTPNYVLCWGYPIRYQEMAGYASDNCLDVALTGEPDTTRANCCGRPKR
ncbi:hypothetical protein SERLA73DRAFT_189297 [Serpula lacrymans var. lacrymans S7.3]|uniref:Uncharacterized protein n=2 Tax=Serpula lacrymans var. lacrymans TaxID=341189 RepID=F8QDB5_SERL3|nr:uncharacterized protein SERLADRAFT_480046 [Serpula lacrymans var. lacrymans S7.9]EGN93586.1 hypothetical protein SERLA73DRAFT_189297 [Serpula lacrymans var. lacrymans S7.3]EGO18958.1 hypothetical protein SERLADRAFT_480046 [Serpula lacrymans var. lacrymans S7.9]